MKKVICSILLLLATGCTNYDKSFDTRKYDISCVQTKEVLVKRCVSLWELLIPKAQADDWFMNPANPLSPISPLNPAYQDNSPPCTDKLFKETVCAEYRVRLK